ncbi:hypothetical protein AB0302_04455, partial [Micrococcus sp. NPDC078436]|uniref:phage tail protein n=1 Tax=Micrococcus sp. NPDC078436 TaxID=3154960 RepID=UPI00344BC66E
VPAWSGISSAVKVAWAVISAVFELLMGGVRLLGDIAVWLWEGWQDAWRYIVDATSQAISAVVEFVSGLVSDVVRFFSALYSQASEKVSELWSRVRSFFSDGIERVKSLVSDFVTRVVGFYADLFRSATDKVREGMDSAKRGFSDGMEAARRTVSDGIDRVLGFFRDLPGNVLRALGDLGGTLRQSGEALLNGFMDGLRGGFDRAKGVVEGGMAKIREFFPFSPAKRGPFSGRGYTTYSGRALSRDFADAIAGEDGYLADAAEQYLSAADLTLNPTLTEPALAALSASAGWAGGAMAGPSAQAAPSALAGFPDEVILVLDDGTKLRTHIEGITTAQAASWVAGLQQPLRQTVGSH